LVIKDEFCRAAVLKLRKEQNAEGYDATEVQSQ